MRCSELVAADGSSGSFWKFVEAAAAWEGLSAATDEQQYAFVKEQGAAVFPKLSLDLFEVRDSPGRPQPFAA